MKLSKRIALLTKIYERHGDLDVKVADKEIGYTFSDACFSPSTARFDAKGRFICYTDDPIKTNAVVID